MTAAVATIALTSGEPAGIGPELCARIAQHAFPCRLVILADEALFASRAAAIGCSIRPPAYHPQTQAHAGAVELLHLPVAAQASAGRLDPANARYVLALLDRALEGCRGGEFAAMVTAPLHKGVINAAGIPFTGHTEYLAQKTGASQVVMLLVGGGLRVALATTHLALKDVAAALTRAGLERTLRTLAAELEAKLGIAGPRILVAGLNPHAGEGGYLGREEIDVIAPVVAALRAEGLKVSGPSPADTLFTPAQLAHADCVLAMYHDQGLPVLKYASFGHGVNVTLGLPIIRTSVDHGTALDLAGTGRADPGSLIAAVETAIQMAGSRSKKS